ncbi:uncharacterized protein Smp_200910 [Schistosoma mansoni]|uniref:Smp_200910 n=1 Tax=Schistosoma mansoni TaxID=6183 RepID=G4VAW9_SCHMA|nr:uncharacterized protein Smp_200910 [Schistosoma mansoni]|eukprot:XP_018648413.1 uncharacterized protein Smp_200910 [Schistosoma mansoni]
MNIIPRLLYLGNRVRLEFGHLNVPLSMYSFCQANSKSEVSFSHVRTLFITLLSHITHISFGWDNIVILLSGISLFMCSLYSKLNQSSP